MNRASHTDNVPETRFGKWFLGTQTWRVYVLTLAVDELCRLATDLRFDKPRVLDVGCGTGAAFPLLAERLSPASIAGVDSDKRALACTDRMVKTLDCPITLQAADVTALPFDNASFDVVFCHQTLHHIRRQRTALAEIHRILKPDGILLLAESCRAFIYSPLVRLLFRHPMEVQRTAKEYLSLLMSAGFVLDSSRFSTTAPWWSQPDLGLVSRALPARPPRRHDTQLCVVASRSGSGINHHDAHD